MAKRLITRERNHLKNRQKRVRVKTGKSQRPRLSVFRSNKYIYAQVIDKDGQTVAGIRGDEAKGVGESIAKMAIKKGHKQVVFDRGGYKYHGNVKLVAEGAREGGLEF